MKDFIQPITREDIAWNDWHQTDLIGNIIERYDFSQSLNDYDIVILGVEEDRAALSNKGTAQAPNIIRKYFYGLDNWFPSVKILDLGNVIIGKDIDNTIENLGTVLYQSQIAGAFTIILGGSHDLVKGQIKGFDSETGVSLVNVDETLDWRKERNLSSKNFLASILEEPNNSLYSYAHLGLQAHYSSVGMYDRLLKQGAELFRLGELREDIKKVEPAIRDADIMAMDISVIRQSDAPGNEHATPNGLFGEEACQLARYGGASNQLKSLGIYEYNPQLDEKDQTAKLIAQMIWYCISGYSGKYTAKIEENNADFMKYLVQSNDSEITFWKHHKDDKWWIELPEELQGKRKYIACTYEDYIFATNNELPDRYLLALERS